MATATITATTIGRSINTTENPDRMAAVGGAFGKAGAILLIAAGLATAITGARVLSRAIGTADLVAAGNSVHSGVSDLSHAELRATADRLQAAASAPARTADETGALTFLYYAAAQASLRAGDRATAAGEMA